MILEINADTLRINARKTDAFDIFNIQHYIGPNPYLETAALVFDFALTGHLAPRPIEDYVAIISDRFPELGNQTADSYAHLFARTYPQRENSTWGCTLIAGISNLIRISLELASKPYMPVLSEP
jgi:hypothetical protein